MKVERRWMAWADGQHLELGFVFFKYCSVIFLLLILSLLILSRGCLLMWKLSNRFIRSPEKMPPGSRLSLNSQNLLPQSNGLFFLFSFFLIQLGLNYDLGNRSLDWRGVSTGKKHISHIMLWPWMSLDQLFSSLKSSGKVSSKFLLCSLTL